MVQKPELIAFSHYKMGGVQNFYYNLLRILSQTGEFDIVWIYDDSDDMENARLAQPYGIGKEIIFKSDLKEDKTVYDRFKRLSKYVSDRPGLIVTNFYLELSALHVHRRKNKTIYFVCHDEQYLRQAKEYEFLIDVFIAHNPQFYKAMRALFPHREKDIHYLPYGITLRNLPVKPVDTDKLRIIYAARHVEHKGVRDLPEIIATVEAVSPHVEWMILGDGPMTPYLKEQFSQRPNIRFYNPPTNEEVVELMAQNDVYILPSYLDGLPVAMLEAMSAGCVPVLYRFNEGILDILKPEEGFIVSMGDKAGFADKIIQLYNNRNLLQQMKVAGMNKVREEYDINKCVKGYKDLFLRYKEFKRPVQRKFIAYGGWMEHPVIPSFVRNGFRSIKKLVS